MHLIHKDSTQARRDFLHRCAASAFGLSVPSFLSNAIAESPSAGSTAPGFGKAKHVIFLMMKGGMTHVDTLDPKEKSKTPETELVANSADGQFTNYLARTAEVADRMCVIRSMTAKIGVHGPASYFMRTGYTENRTILHPMLGAWGHEVLGRSHEILPSTVSVCSQAENGNGYFPSAASPLPILDPEAGLQHLKTEKSPEELRIRLEMLNKLDRGFRESYPDRNVTSYTDFYEDAVRMMSGKEGEAFDITKESEAMRDAYGRSTFGQGCLLARRLVEAGVRFVEVRSSGWDMHTDLVGRMGEVAPPMDQAYAQLILDLESRGLLQDTLVVLTTEFGRSPSFNGGGRNHFPIAFSTALAGGGVKCGLVYGATDDEGGTVIDKPTEVGQFHSTIGWAMGIRPDHEVFSPSGRPFKIGGGKEPIYEVFA